MATTRTVATALLLLPALAACDISAECLPWFQGFGCFQSDLGEPCSDNDEQLSKVTVKAASNDVVSDPGFENCRDFYCASTQGSKPYCTRRCESKLDCDPGGLPCIPGQPCERDNWDCEVLVEFGVLACQQVDESGSCETDPQTGKVVDPVKYCRGLAVEAGTPSDQGSADAGQ